MLNEEEQRDLNFGIELLRTYIPVALSVLGFSYYFDSDTRIYARLPKQNPSHDAWIDRMTESDAWTRKFEKSLQKGIERTIVIEVIPRRSSTYAFEKKLQSMSESARNAVLRQIRSAGGLGDMFILSIYKADDEENAFRRELEGFGIHEFADVLSSLRDFRDELLYS